MLHNTFSYRTPLVAASQASNFIMFFSEFCEMFFITQSVLRRIFFKEHL